jgi:hypothetical protein
VDKTSDKKRGRNKNGRQTPKEVPRWNERLHLLVAEDERQPVLQFLMDEHLNKKGQYCLMHQVGV